MSSNPDLKLDWCSYQAAKYAVERWHYSKRMPAGKHVHVGVWEGDVFVGVMLYGLGACNLTRGEKYGLARSHD